MYAYIDDNSDMYTKTWHEEYILKDMDLKLGLFALVYSPFNV